MGGESGTLTVTVPPLGELSLLVGRHYQKVYYGLRNTLRSRGMEALPTFRHGNQLIVLPSIPIDHPYRHHSRVVRFHPRSGMTFRKSSLQNYLMEVGNPILRSENGVTEVAYPIFCLKMVSWKSPTQFLRSKLGSWR